MAGISCWLSLLIVFAVFFPTMVIAAENQAGYARDRLQMVDQQIVARGIKDTSVIEAMKKVPRHYFVPEGRRHLSYVDSPLPIGERQTISQPYIVAFMTEVLKLNPEDRILEIGTGSGYQAAILAELVKEVYTIEIIPSLGKKARKLLENMGYRNIFVKIGDGYKGWPGKAPFDAVIVTCAPENIPRALIEQLEDGGRLIIPVGPAGTVQELIMGVKIKDQLKTESILPVIFVPMVRGKK
ncbi:protein-L-isoaspartate(D-aspartate) O-methyltransferase [Candidatus Latescibacterota bacterium]